MCRSIRSGVSFAALREKCQTAAYDHWSASKHGNSTSFIAVIRFVIWLIIFRKQNVAYVSHLGNLGKSGDFYSKIWYEPCSCTCNTGVVWL